MPDLLAAPPIELYGQREPMTQHKLLRQMRQNFQGAEEYERPNRAEMLDDLRFRKGGDEQWPDGEAARRKAMKRPCLTMNTCPHYEAQITNEMRQNSPAGKVLPVGNGADVQTAKVIQGILRHFDYASDGKTVRQVAFDSAARIGVGYWRIALEYDDWMSFDQEPRIAQIRNPFQVYLDHAAQKSTGKDANWGFLFENQDKEAFKEYWGLTESHLTSNMTGTGDTWVFEKHIRVAEYFWRERQRMTLIRTRENGILLLEPLLLERIRELETPFQQQKVQQFVQFLCTPRYEEGRMPSLENWIRQKVGTARYRLDGLPEQFINQYVSDVQYLLDDMASDGKPAARFTESSVIHWIKTNGTMILEESIWPGEYIPIVRVVGEELVIDNEVTRAGIIRNAKDPMRLENYLVTAQVEHIASSPVPPWLVGIGQIDDPRIQLMWETANRIPYAYLPYKQVDVNGQPLPPPIRNSYEPPIQAITLSLQTAQNYTQNAIGVYPPNVGDMNQERSGRAIAASKSLSSTGQFHFSDNLANSMKYSDEQMLDLAPKTLTPQKIQRMIGDDGAPQLVQLYDSRLRGPDGQPMQKPQLEPGIAAVYDLGTGKHDIVFEVGPSYATKRQETAEQMSQWITAMPGVMAPLAWRLVKAQDWQEADEISDLMKKVPGQILDDPGNDPQAQALMMRQQLHQMQQQMQMLDAGFQQAQQQLEQVTRENQLLRAGHDLKAKELDLQAQEQAVEALAKQRELDIKWYEAQTERQAALAREEQGGAD